MSNRQYNEYSLCQEKRVINVFAKVTFGATGAPTLSAINSKGVLSVTRNGAGDYTFVFGVSASRLDSFVKLLGVDYVFNSGAAAPASPSMYIKADTTTSTATASINIIFNLAGVATDPASGEIVYLQFIFGDSTAP
jgi:hypothetical protein